jgi:hypothetical protein
VDPVPDPLLFFFGSAGNCMLHKVTRISVVIAGIFGKRDNIKQQDAPHEDNDRLFNVI